MVRGIPKRRSRANNCAWSQVSVVTVCWERFEIAKNRHHHHRVIKREVRFAGLPVAVCSVLSSPYRSIGRGRLFVRSFARSGVSIQPRDFVMPLSLSLSLSPSRMVGGGALRGRGHILPSHIEEKNYLGALPGRARRRDTFTS